MANDASSSLALIAPLAAMIADTPQIDEPIASRLVSFGESLNVRPSQVISTIDNGQLERDRHQADAAELEHVAEQEAHAEQDDAELEEEFVGGDAGLEDLRHADGVGDDQSDDDRPQHIFDVRQRKMIAPCRKPLMLCSISLPL